MNLNIYSRPHQKYLLDTQPQILYLFENNTCNIWFNVLRMKSEKHIFIMFLHLCTHAHQSNIFFYWNLISTRYIFNIYLRAQMSLYFNARTFQLIVKMFKVWHFIGTQSGGVKREDTTLYYRVTKWMRHFMRIREKNYSLFQRCFDIARARFIRVCQKNHGVKRNLRAERHRLN